MTIGQKPGTRNQKPENRCQKPEARGQKPEMRYYPIHLDIQNRNCLVVGGGSVGTRKVATLLACGANVTVISPQATAQLQKHAQVGSITLINRRYRAADLDDIFLVIGATDDETLYRVAKQLDPRIAAKWHCDECAERDGDRDDRGEQV